MFPLLFKLVCAWFAFFLPCFSTYQVLSKRPINDAQLERVAKYWTIIGAWVAAEYTAGWLFSWLPFYWEIKTVCLLFLSLPQTQGSTWVYDMYLGPFFAKNEQNIEAGIGSIQAKVFALVQDRFSALFDLVLKMLNKETPAGQPPAPGSNQAGAPQGGLSPSALMGLWKTYGPAVVSAVSEGKRQPTAARGFDTASATTNGASSFGAPAGVNGASSFGAPASVNLNQGVTGESRIPEEPPNVGFSTGFNTPAAHPDVLQHLGNMPEPKPYGY